MIEIKYFKENGFTVLHKDKKRIGTYSDFITMEKIFEKLNKLYGKNNWFIKSKPSYI